MKNYLSEEHFDQTKLFIRKMRTTCFIVMVFASSVFAIEGNTQTAKVSIAMKNAYIIEVIRAIESQTDYLFVYNKNEIDLTRRVDLEVNNKSVAEVLNGVFVNTKVVYAMEGANIMLMQTSDSQQQQKSVSGKVTDSSGGPLPGVSVVVKGTTTGTITDGEGKYLLMGITEKAVLQYSFVGMKTQEIAFTGKSELNIMMEDETVGIEEVVALGYTTQKKRDMIGSVAKISDQQISIPAYKNFTAALQGKATGVYVTGNTVRIRGLNSISLSTEPLWIIDGIPGNGSNLNPNDIESISILKDASATALYGSSGANGVITVTTKSMKGQKTQLQVDFDSGISEYIGTDWDFLSTEEFFKMYDLAKQNASKYEGTVYAPYDPNKAFDYNSLIKTRMTREEAEGYQHNGIKDATRQGLYKQIYLTGNKAFDKGSALLTVTYRDELEIMKGLSNKKFLARTSFNFSPVKNVDISFNSISNYTSATKSGASSRIMQRTPFMPIYDSSDPTGYWGPGENPVIGADKNFRNDNEENFSSTNYLKLGLDIPFIKGLSMAATGNANIDMGRNVNWYSKSVLAYGNMPISTATEGSRFGSSYLIRGEVNFNREIGQHTIGFLALAEGKKGYGRSLYASGSNLNGSYPTIGTPVDKNSIVGSISEGGSVAYIGRMTYKFKDRYLLEANIRRDGMSALSANNRYATFPSFGAGWILSEESFLKSGNIDLLKIRGSIGKTGNAAIPSFRYLPVLGIANPSGSSFENYQYTYIKNVASDVKWETSDNYDIGLDYGFLGNKINGSIAYYLKNVTGLLLDVPVPRSAGLALPGVPATNSILTNVGNLKNEGLELSVNIVPIRKNDFSWELSFNHTIQNNKVLSLHPAVDVTGTGIFGRQNITLTKKGYEIATYYMPEFAGIDTEKGIAMIWERDPVIFKETGKTVKTGNIIPATSNNGGKNQFLQEGKSNMPDYFGGLRNSLRYKDFDLNIMITYSGGHYFYEEVDFRGIGMGDYNSTSRILNESWSKPGDKAIFGEPIINGGFYYDDAGNFSKKKFAETLYLTRNLLPGDNIQLKEITFGYNLPTILATKMMMQKVRLYANINNALYWAKAGKNGNPEVDIAGNNIDGHRRGLSFLPRTYSIGISVKF